MRLFVSCEGVDCVGKTVLVTCLLDGLRRRGLRVAVKEEFARQAAVREPIRDALTRSLFISEGFSGGPVPALAFMLYADVANLSATLSENQRWDVLLADRALDSVAVYQGIFAGLDPPALLRLVDHLEEIYALLRLPIPDLTLLLRSSPERIAERFRKRYGRELRADEARHLAALDRMYGMLATSKSRYRVVDADRGKEEIATEAIDAVVRVEAMD